MMRKFSFFFENFLTSRKFFPLVNLFLFVFRSPHILQKREFHKRRQKFHGLWFEIFIINNLNVKPQVSCLKCLRKFYTSRSSSLFFSSPSFLFSTTESLSKFYSSIIKRKNFEEDALRFSFEKRLNRSLQPELDFVAGRGTFRKLTFHEFLLEPLFDSILNTPLLPKVPFKLKNFCPPVKLETFLLQAVKSSWRH